MGQPETIFLTNWSRDKFTNDGKFQTKSVSTREMEYIEGSYYNTLPISKHP